MSYILLLSSYENDAKSRQDKMCHRLWPIVRHEGWFSLGCASCEHFGFTQSTKGYQVGSEWSITHKIQTARPELVTLIWIQRRPSPSRGGQNLGQRLQGSQVLGEPIFGGQIFDF